MKKLKTGVMYRTARIESVREEGEEDDRLVSLAFSSEEPVDRWFGVEILDHSRKSVDLDRLRNGGAFLVGHDTRDQVGVVEQASIDSDRVGRAVVRLGRSARAEEILVDIRDGIRQHVSVGYRIHRMTLEETSDDGADVYRATEWEPFEISSVPIPADKTVGVGRMDDGTTREFITSIEEARTVPKLDNPNPTTGDLLPDDPAPVPEPKRTVNEPTPRIVDNSHDVERAKLDERKRTTEISAIAREYPVTAEIADKAQREGWTLDQFRAQALPLVASNPQPKADAPLSELGLSRKELKDYSLMRAIRALTMAKLSGVDPVKHAPFEMECSRAIAETLDKEARGILVPHDVQQRTPWIIPRNMQEVDRLRSIMASRTPPMDTGENVHLVGTDHLAANFIDALRARTVLFRAGAIALDGLVGNVSIPKLAGSAAFGWVAEDADSSDEDPATASVTLSPKTVTASVPMTRRLLLQSSPSVEAIIRNDLVNGAAIAIDNGSINGGTNAPTGILNETGVNTVSIADFAAGAGIPTWAEAVQFETVVDTALALEGSLSYVTTPSVSGGMKTAAKDAGSGLFVQEGNSCNGYTVSRTTLMAAKTILFGDYSSCLIGMWGMLDIVVDTATKVASGGIVLRAFQDVDEAVRHGQSFAKSTA